MSKYISTNITRFLNENAISDISYNKEAKRVFNIIKNNIDNIILTPTPNDVEKDFVKDSRGNIHILKGVKFNLNQLDKKYDIDILLVHTLAKNSNHHYDQNANRIVFFIISQTENQLDFETNSQLARLRFKAWITENIFIHEFIHFLDANRYNNTYSFSTPTSDTNYYNSPEEYNAYSHEMIYNIIKNKKKLLDAKSFDIFFKKAMKFGDAAFINNLNDKYKNKLKTRLYKLFIQLSNEK